MKRFLLIISIAGLSLPATTQAAKSETKQVIGFLTQVAATAGVYALGNQLAATVCPSREESLDRQIASMFIILAEFKVAKDIQRYISQRIFRFGTTDWASADNNYANFIGWLLTSVRFQFTSE